MVVGGTNGGNKSKKRVLGRIYDVRTYVFMRCQQYIYTAGSWPEERASSHQGKKALLKNCTHAPSIMVQHHRQHSSNPSLLLALSARKSRTCYVAVFHHAVFIRTREERTHVTLLRFAQRAPRLSYYYDYPPLPKIAVTER